MNYWFTGCTHFQHSNILRYCNRPFKNAKEMDDSIVFNWNGVVKKEDLVFHLGDYIFGRNDYEFDTYFKKLNGLVVLVKGNHERLAWKNRNKFWASHNGYHEIKINDQKIVLSHYPLLTWNCKHHGAWMLHSHCHYNLAVSRKEGTQIGKILDVGVDGNDFKPYNFEDIKLIMDKKPTFPNLSILNDHHTKPNL